MPIEAGTIYFAPPDYHLLVDKGPSIALSTDEPVNFSRPSIDLLMQSAVDVYGARLAAVILTGANADGAAGLAQVQRAGGTAIVEDPDTAQVAVMPVAALQRVRDAVVSSLDGIAAVVADARCRARWKVSVVIQQPTARVKILLVDDLAENLLALGRCCGATPSNCSRRGRVPPLSSCCWCTNSVSRWWTCRCPRWTASNSRS